MSTTGCLREEHQLILRVLDCFEVALERAEVSGEMGREAFGPFVEFFQGFADRCHHCKEEDRLFPCLEKKGVPREGGPIGVMLHEHEIGRAHVRSMSEALDAISAGADDLGREALLRHGREYLDLLRMHIAKEDHVLFNMADQVIGDDDRIALEQSYREAEGEAEYQDTITRCRAIAQRLIAQYGQGSSGMRSNIGGGANPPFRD